jgi:hypothetical protein
MSAFYCQSKNLPSSVTPTHSWTQDNILFTYTTYGWRICCLPEQFYTSWFYVPIFRCLTFFWLRSSVTDLSVLYFKLTWKCQVLQQLFSVRNILSSSNLFIMSSFTWNDCGLCFMPVVHLVAMLIMCSIITCYTEWKLRTHMQCERKRIYIEICFFYRKSIEAVNLQLNHMGKLWY